MPDEGKDWNVLEWTVEGERYKAECEGDPLFGCDPVDCQYYHDERYLHLVGYDEHHGIVIHKQRNLKIDTPNILNKKDYFKYGRPKTGDTCTSAHKSDTSLSYQLFIEDIDTSNKIITGIFSFQGINDCQDTVQVKDGYFKLSYRP